MPILTAVPQEGAIDETVGELLRARRLALSLTIEDVANKTKIRKVFLLALENNKFNELPGSVYVVGFIRNYSTYLQLQPDYLISLYMGCASHVDAVPSYKIYLPRKQRIFLNFQSIVVSLLLIALASLLWAVYQSSKMDMSSLNSYVFPDQGEAALLLEEGRALAQKHEDVEAQRLLAELADDTTSDYDEEFHEEDRYAQAPLTDAPGQGAQPVRVIDESAVNHVKAIPEGGLKADLPVGVRTTPKSTESEGRAPAPIAPSVSVDVTSVSRAATASQEAPLASASSSQVVSPAVSAESPVDLQPAGVSAPSYPLYIVASEDTWFKQEDKAGVRKKALYLKKKDRVLLDLSQGDKLSVGDVQFVEFELQNGQMLKGVDFFRIQNGFIENFLVDLARLPERKAEHKPVVQRDEDLRAQPTQATQAAPSTQTAQAAPSTQAVQAATVGAAE